MEQRAREGGKEAANEYAQCVQEQAVVEEAEKENINRIRNAELERLAKLSDGKLMAEAEFKRQWMEDVDTSRQEQIRQKKNRGRINTHRNGSICCTGTSSSTSSRRCR